MSQLLDALLFFGFLKSIFSLSFILGNFHSPISKFSDSFPNYVSLLVSQLKVFFIFVTVGFFLIAFTFASYSFHFSAKIIYLPLHVV